MEAYGGGGAAEGEEGLKEDEGEVSAGGIAGKDNLICGDCGVEGSRWWGEEREVGDKAV